MKSNPKSKGNIRLQRERREGVGRKENILDLRNVISSAGGDDPTRKKQRDHRKERLANPRRRSPRKKTGRGRKDLWAWAGAFAGT